MPKMSCERCLLANPICIKGDLRDFCWRHIEIPHASFKRGMSLFQRGIAAVTVGSEFPLSLF